MTGMTTEFEGEDGLPEIAPEAEVLPAPPPWRQPRGSDRQRYVASLREEGLTWRQVADRMQLSVSTCRQLWTRHRLGQIPRG